MCEFWFLVLFPGKVKLAVRRKVGEVLRREGYFIIQYTGVSALTRQMINVGPSFEFHLPTWEDW